MNRNDIYAYEEEIYRIILVHDDQCLVISCNDNRMPVWRCIGTFSGFFKMTNEDLYVLKGIELVEDNEISPEHKRIMYERYTIIAPALAVIGDTKARNYVIAVVSEEAGISKQTVRGYLKKYLIYQNIQVLLPKERVCISTELTKDQKNMRWSLNKYFYTHKKNTLHTAYIEMIKEKYCDEAGKILEQHPSFYQYRYFYRKTRKLQNYYISRNGLTYYQRNNRPCVGDNVRVYASAPGMGMLDATVCDIYLVNVAGQVIGRPILTACIDAYSGICMGYSLGWEGGNYSIRDMTLNIIRNKKAHCLEHGILIDESDWPVDKLPGRLITDQGAEYIGSTYEQITELGITLENLPPYRPDLKGPVEKFFDIIQNLFKKQLKGKGVIEPDFMERGGHDYRKDACLTMESFEKIILRCIIYYNSQNVLEEYPFTADMLDKKVKPYSNDIWNYGLKIPGTNLITVDTETLILCLLPRTYGKYSRFGLSVNKLHYKNNAYKEKLLSGGEVLVAYDPDCTNYVWVVENGKYIRFDLIESRFKNRVVHDVQNMQYLSKRIIDSEYHNNLQAEVDLSRHINDIADSFAVVNDKSIKNIKEHRKQEQHSKHRIHTEEAGLYE